MDKRLHANLARHSGPRHKPAPSYAEGAGVTVMEPATNFTAMLCCIFNSLALYPRHAGESSASPLLGRL
jgi:hypothetical protein